MENPQPDWHFKTRKTLGLKSRSASSGLSLAGPGNEVPPRTGRKGRPEKRGRREETPLAVPRQ